MWRQFTQKLCKKYFDCIKEYNCKQEVGVKLFEFRQRFNIVGSVRERHLAYKNLQ